MEEKEMKVGKRYKSIGLKRRGERGHRCLE